jgi:hypothetical protein
MRALQRTLIVAFGTVAVSACSTAEVSRNLYEGVKARNESYKSTPMERTKGEGLSYDQYERERKAGAASRSE